MLMASDQACQKAERAIVAMVNAALSGGAIDLASWNIRGRTG